MSELGLAVDLVHARNANLVVLSITDFGQAGPYRDWVATDWTLLAMGGVLSRSCHLSGADDPHRWVDHLGGVTRWTRALPPREVTATLQAAGVPAGFMQRPDGFEDDPQLRARDFLRVLEQPGLEPRVVDNTPFRSQRIPVPAKIPAPEPGEHTRQICTGLLGLTTEEVDRLIASGVLEESARSAEAGEPALSR
jgi:crotonobetainyl-CoA:carnitine CoA-transferase CaiB-like acyl-CoA transferase